MKQHSLFPGQFLPVHGGALAIGKRKVRRPLARKRPIHLVLKSKKKLYLNRDMVELETLRLGKKFGLKIYAIATAQDHLHFIALIPGRAEYIKFIRALTGLLARRLGKGIWSLLPFSRVIHWGKDFFQLKKYIDQNKEEAEGRRPYTPRKNWYARFLKTR